ncbi:MAG: aminotransferase class IV family protein [Bacteroidales bacterium]|nr:aminotransferase class IV family protein [Bacteroidales bacterium]
MSLLFETIKIDNSKACNIEYHNERLNRSRRALFSSEDPIDLAMLIIVPENMRSGVVRCRVAYEDEIRKVEYFPYQPRKIRSLKLIECDDIDYSFKFDDRTKLNELLKQKGNADDILIVKNKFITDTSFSNIVFHDGKKWITPSTPLLQGTKRTQLLKEKIIKEDEIKVSDLRNFSKAVLINAMVGFEPGDYIDVGRINF